MRASYVLEIYFQILNNIQQCTRRALIYLSCSRTLNKTTRKELELIFLVPQKKGLSVTLYLGPNKLNKYNLLLNQVPYLVFFQKKDCSKRNTSFFNIPYKDYSRGGRFIRAENSTQINERDQPYLLIFLKEEEQLNIVISLILLHM